jgi:hypothetical protein
MHTYFFRNSYSKFILIFFEIQAASPVSISISADGKTATVSGLESGHVTTHVAYLRDTGRGVTSNGVDFVIA